MVLAFFRIFNLAFFKNLTNYESNDPGQALLNDVP
jgi:hypothetical protein